MIHRLRRWVSSILHPSCWGVPKMYTNWRIYSWNRIMFCFVCTIFLGSRVTWLGVFFLEYNVYNESWEYSLFSIEGSSAREKKRERKSYAIIVSRSIKSFMKNSVVVISFNFVIFFLFLTKRVSIKRKFREVFLSCTGIKSRKTVVRVYNYNRNRNFAILGIKKEIMINDIKRINLKI